VLTRTAAGLGRYRAILRQPAARRFAAAAFVGRLPMTMVGLVLVALLRSHASGFTETGLVVAAYGGGAAAGAPVMGRLSDRRGQAAVVPIAILVHVAAFAALFLLVRAAAAAALVGSAAAVAGLANPQLPALVRARWAAYLAEPDQVADAFALEAGLDEFAWILGPGAASLALALWGPAEALTVVVALTAIGGLAYAAQRRTQPPVHASARRPPATRHVAVVALFAPIGLILGSADIGMISYGTAHPLARQSGVLLVCFAIGGMVATLAYGARAGDPGRTFVWLAVLVLAASWLLIPATAGRPTMIACSVLAGATVTPFMSTGYTLVERTAPPGTATSAVAWAIAAVGAGITAGSAAAGPLIDRFGPRGAFALTAAASTAAAAAAVAGRAADRRPERELV
jgi:predicted MFS family arabinose efflux permease